jgi:23S rRNA pseudouridine1911/1915/1917 synthase
VHFEVPPGLEGQRADKALVRLLEDAGKTTPRAEVQRWIADGRVCIDGTPITKKTALAAGEMLEVDPAPPRLTNAKPDASVVFDVVHEDDDLIVVDKPAGLVVHPARGHADGTLVNGLLARGGFKADNADPLDEDGHLRPGIVHRIDKDTSGLLVVAKHARCREGLKALFQTHDIERAYLAITLGQTMPALFDTTHGRHPKHRRRFTSKLGEDRPNTKRAVTRVSVVERHDKITLVRCTLQTGRTHQIRVHLAEQAGTPIFADALYRGVPGDPKLRVIADALGRQALHAAVLGFVHPITGEKLRWERALPEDMAGALTALTTPTT